jgi:hypothetical protein
MRVAAQDPPRLVLVEGVIGMELGLKAPFAGDDASVGWRSYKGPRSAALEGVELQLHRGLPVGVPESSAN